jgi:hypothetical protein
MVNLKHELVGIYAALYELPRTLERNGDCPWAVRELERVRDRVRDLLDEMDREEDHG